MADSKQTQPDETILGGESSVPGTAGSAAGGPDEAGDATSPDDEDATKPPER